MIRYLNLGVITFLTDVRQKDLKYLLIFSLILDIYLYRLPFLNTFLTIILYILNRNVKKSSNVISYLIKSLINLSIFFLIYSLYNLKIINFSNLWPFYLVNSLLSIILYYMKDEALEIK